MTPMDISNTENHKNYHMTEVMCPMGSFKYNYGMWLVGILLRSDGGPLSYTKTKPVAVIK